MASDSCRMYLIRHGATPNNEAAPPRIQGARSDPPLSPLGLDQARRAADFLSALSIDAVYSSPLLRARQTAEPTAATRGLSIECVAALIEIDCGQWEGLTWAEAERRDPEAFQAFTSNPIEMPYLGGENLRSVQDRVVLALEQLLRENRGRSIVVVAHNMVNRCYLAHLLAVPLPAYRRVTQDNGGISVIDYRDGQTRAETINSTWHLAADYRGRESSRNVETRSTKSETNRE